MKIVFFFNGLHYKLAPACGIINGGTPVSGLYYLFTS